ncbi:hypothetical protein SAY87_030909 [Trapa incisa]|uniref:Uncharacterized protein n=1 Tax=Trapa incisa TaxID=236973 RepID=A0AAN7KWI4_9MYRT|nr:hypothetical protein SAY87_030909 [Trapa incisa]
MLGCTSDGNLDEAGFSRPMPWIGLYIAGASLTCGLAMGADALVAFRYRKFWFPCRYFSLNATSLTVISVAIKLSVDLNTPMPRQQDQLSKLSSSALICTVMANSMPSLGNMGTSELLSNMVALAILIVTAIVNISIQISTGVIYSFFREHVFLMFLMLLLLAMVCFSATAVPTTKTFLEMKYCKRHQLELEERKKKPVGTPMIERLKEDLVKYWMMAYTGNPQFVVGRSVTCTASGALCLLSAATLAEAMIRSYLIAHNKFNFCKGESDYKWSSTVILISQTIAVGIGTVAPGLRWFVAIKFRCPKIARKTYKDDFKLEKYWIKMLVEMKECPFFLNFRSRRFRKIVHGLKNCAIEVCILVQTAIVSGSKVISLISILLVSWILIVCRFFEDLKTKIELKSKNNEDSDQGGRGGSMLDMSRYVLHLEGEEELVQRMMRNNWNTTVHYVNMGKKKEPKHLIWLLEEHCTNGFRKSSGLLPGGEGEPPLCWSLPIVTLASIAAAIPGIERSTVNQLLRSINEGLAYVELVEEGLGRGDRDLTNVRKAANVVWLGVDLYGRWLDMDLRRVRGGSPRGALEALSEAAKGVLASHAEKPTMAECSSEAPPSSWPVRIQAAHSMYRIAQAYKLSEHPCEGSDGNIIMFRELLGAISDIMGACLTNLERVISTECCRSSIEERKESVQRAGVLLGKAERVIEILSRRQGDLMSHPGPDRPVASIDQWLASARFRDRDGMDSRENLGEAYVSVDLCPC